MSDVLHIEIVQRWNRFV